MSAEDPTPSTGTGDWTVFKTLQSEWPEDLVADLGRWKQGHIVTDVRVTWLMAPGADDVTQVDNSSEYFAPANHEALSVKAAILCSQTCDIGATQPGDAHPFILLAPLLPEGAIADRGLASLAKKDKVGYLFPTLSPDGDASRWYADLRLLIPASKTILRGREPKEGFATEADSLAFGETLAQKFRRPALSEKLSGTIPKALKKFVQDNGSHKPAFAKVEQVRILIRERDRLNPERGTLLIYTNQPLTPEEQETWLLFNRQLKPLLDEAGVTLTPFNFTTAETQPAATYRNSCPIHCDLLGHSKFP